MKKSALKTISLLLSGILFFQDIVCAGTGSSGKTNSALQVESFFKPQNLRGRLELAAGYVIKQISDLDGYASPVTVWLDDRFTATIYFRACEKIQTPSGQVRIYQCSINDTRNRRKSRCRLTLFPDGSIKAGKKDKLQDLPISGKRSKGQGIISPEKNAKDHPDRRNRALEALQDKNANDRSAHNGKHTNIRQARDLGHLKIILFAAIGIAGTVLMAVLFQYNFYTTIPDIQAGVLGYYGLDLRNAVIDGMIILSLGLWWAVVWKYIRRAILLKYTVRDTESLSRFIAKLEADKFGLSKGFFSRRRDAEDYYEKKYLRQIYEILFLRLARDFDGTKDFIAYARKMIKNNSAYDLRRSFNDHDKELVERFMRIRVSKHTAGASIGLYGVLLFYLTNQPRKYFEHIYDRFIQTRPANEISLGRQGVSYHARGNSVVHFCSKGFLFEGEQPFYRKSIRYSDMESRVEDRKGSDNAKKINAAIQMWKDQAEKPGSDHLKKRIANFLSSSTVVELDISTNMLFSDPDYNVARPVHAGRSRRVIYIPKTYLDSIKLITDGSDDDMEQCRNQLKELAVWINFGQRFIDLQDEMIQKGYSVEDVQRARSDLNFLFFKKGDYLSEDSGILPYEMLKGRLFYFMRRDTLTKYTTLYSDIWRLARDADINLSDGQVLESREIVSSARLKFGKLLYKYDAIGLRSQALLAYKKMSLATDLIQFYDTGELPCLNYRELLLTALRYELYGEFLFQLRRILSGKVFPRKIKRSELMLIRYYAEKRLKGEKSLETDILNALSSQEQAASSVKEALKIRAVTREAKDLLDRFYAYPFMDLNEKEYDDDRHIKREKPVSLGEVEDFVEQYAKNDFSVYAGTADPVLERFQVENVMDQIASAFGGKRHLNGKILFDIDAGDLKMSLFASNVYNMKCHAIEGNGKMHLRAKKILGQAQDAGLEDHIYLNGNPMNAFDLSWKYFDVVKLIYNEKRFPSLWSEHDKIQAKASEMKNGSVLAVLFTQAQIAAHCDKFEDLEPVYDKPLNIDFMTSGMSLQLYTYRPSRSRHEKWQKDMARQERSGRAFVLEVIVRRIEDIMKKAAEYFSGIRYKHEPEIGGTYPSENQETAIDRSGLRNNAVGIIDEHKEMNVDMRGLTQEEKDVKIDTLDDRIFTEENFLGRIKDPEALAEDIAGKVVSRNLKKKLALVLDIKLGGSHSADIREAFAELERLRREPKYAELLEGFRAESSVSENIARRVEKFKEQGYDVVVFADRSEEKRFEGMTGETQFVYIDENGFPGSAYYPLCEIVAISLEKYFDPGLDLSDKVLLRALNIQSVDVLGNALVFKLLPDAEKYDSDRDLTIRYERLKDFIIAA